MIFQVLDDKRECKGYYTNNELHFSETIPEHLMKTWKYSSHIGDREVECANLYCGNKKLDDVCPEHLQEEWSLVSKKIKAFFNSFQNGKVDINNNCLFGLIPDSFLVDFYRVKNDITDYVLQNYSKPYNYTFLYKLCQVLDEIKNNKLSIDTSVLEKNLADTKVRNLWKKLNRIDHRVNYDMFKTKTGRLSTFPNSFPILTLDKSFRRIIKPSNDLFLELDYNAAEIRTLLALSGQEQPDIDIHEWHIKEIFKKDMTRDEAKKRMFAWLYNPNANDKELEKIYNKNLILNKYYFNNKYIKTIYSRKIECDKHYALNYIIQSTTADLFLKQLVKVWEEIKDDRIRIAFALHDSMVIDLRLSELEMVERIKDIFSETDLGKYKVNVSKGQTFGDMK